MRVASLTAASGAAIFGPPAGASPASQSGAVVKVMGAMLFVLIYLQKFGVTLGGDLQLGLPLVFSAAAFGWLGFKGQLVFDSTRLVLYCATMAFAALSQLFGVSGFSVTSFLLLVLLYVTFTFRWEVSRAELLTLFETFSRLMVAPALFVFAQLAYQVAFGAGASLSIERFVPGGFLVGGYMYESSTEKWITWNRPNGLVFLEPSFCSAFLACVIIHEVHVARRFLRAAFFSAALLGTDGGTGLLMMAIAVPVSSLLRTPALALLGGGAGLVAFVTLQAGEFDLPLVSRLRELGDPGSSGYGRLLLPFESLVRLAGDPAFLLAGKGAGQITAEYGNAWPTTKFIYEYGTVGALCYVALCLAGFVGPYDIPLRIALFCVFQFTGGYLLSPYMILLVFITCTSLSPRPDDPSRSPVRVGRPGFRVSPDPRA